jgi:glutathione S-transferase
MSGGWTTIEKARRQPGLRLVVTAGVPGPWGESAKGVLHVRGVPFAKVPQHGGGPNDDLVDWTGESNAPQAIYEDERARSGWSEIIMLAERLGQGDSLLPEDAADRAQMFGLIHELASEGGFGWSRRLMLLAPIMSLPEDHPARAAFGAMAMRYGFDAGLAEAAPARAALVVGLIRDQLRSQHEAGSEFLIGDHLSALDVYWAAFAALIQPLPEDVCDMPAGLRASYATMHPLLDAAVDPILLEHRDRIYEQYLEMPLDLAP